MGWFSFPKYLINKLVPPLCYHCGLVAANGLLCSLCLSEVVLTDAGSFCGYCYPSYDAEALPCTRCALHIQFLTSQVFIRTPTTQLLDRLLQRKGHAKLAKLMACYFVIQLDALKWSSLPILVGEKGSVFTHSSYGLVEKEISLLLQIPLLTERIYEVYGKEVLVLQRGLVDCVLSRGGSPHLLTLV